jgi:3-oxoacyl-[acyl-carrier protein] reductase
MTDLRLAGQRVLVTGATSGIGHAVAEAMVGAGAWVAASGLGIADAPPDCALRIESDLTAPGAGTALVEQAVAALGGLDVVIAAAGGGRRGTVERCTDELWAEGIAVNLTSVIAICRAAIPHLRAAAHGRILLFGALSGMEPPAGNGIANVTKAGLHALTKTLSRELGESGVLVNCLAPGRVRSAQVDRLFPTEDARREHAEGRIPLGRFAEPGELVPLALLLASPANTYVTGQTIAVDGGMSAAVN